MGLKDEVHVASEAYALSVGKRQQVVVVQHGIERLDPLRVNITITNKPRLYLLVVQIAKRERQKVVKERRSPRPAVEFVFGN